jgi:hypothetical protein
MESPFRTTLRAAIFLDSARKLGSNTHRGALPNPRANPPLIPLGVKITPGEIPTLYWIGATPPLQMSLPHSIQLARAKQPTRTQLQRELPFGATNFAPWYNYSHLRTFISSLRFGQPSPISNRPFPTRARLLPVKNYLVTLTPSLNP